MIKRTITGIIDAGHGWFSVSHVDIRKLGIEDSISGCSYMNRTRVYLEEDCDIAKFVKAAEAAGWKLTFKSNGQRQDWSWVRGLPPYNSYWIKNPLHEGQHIGLYNGAVAIIDSIGNWKIFIKSLNSAATYSVPASNPFNYIRPLA